uniref:phage holin family protein n=1 Tax=Pararhizobium sp. IMCC3301 TaxID=3067904 RepID=UPI00274271C6|nr:phage holin family protein [Pararhizobium sp. IMCC3301]
MSDTTPNKSVGSLLSDAMSNISSLVRSEVDLARAEINENITRAGVAIGMIAGAAIIALVTLNLLVAALVAALTEAGLEAGWSALIVGVILAVIAFVLFGKGINDLKLSSLAPTRTVKNVKRDAEAVKEAYNDK